MASQGAEPPSEAPSSGAGMESRTPEEERAEMERLQHERRTSQRLALRLMDEERERRIQEMHDGGEWKDAAPSEETDASKRQRKSVGEIIQERRLARRERERTEGLDPVQEGKLRSSFILSRTGDRRGSLLIGGYAARMPAPTPRSARRSSRILHQKQISERQKELRELWQRAQHQRESEVAQNLESSLQNRPAPKQLQRLIFSRVSTLELVDKLRAEFSKSFQRYQALQQTWKQQEQQHRAPKIESATGGQGGELVDTEAEGPNPNTFNPNQLRDQGDNDPDAQREYRLALANLTDAQPPANVVQGEDGAGGQDTHEGALPTSTSNLSDSLGDAALEPLKRLQHAACNNNVKKLFLVYTRKHIPGSQNLTFDRMRVENELMMEPEFQRFMEDFHICPGLCSPEDVEKVFRDLNIAGKVAGKGFNWSRRKMTFPLFKSFIDSIVRVSEQNQLRMNGGSAAEWAHQSRRQREAKIAAHKASGTEDPSHSTSISPSASPRSPNAVDQRKGRQKLSLTHAEADELVARLNSPTSASPSVHKRCISGSSIASTASPTTSKPGSPRQIASPHLQHQQQRKLGRSDSPALSSLTSSPRRLGSSQPVTEKAGKDKGLKKGAATLKPQASSAPRTPRSTTSSGSTIASRPTLASIARAKAIAASSERGAKGSTRSLQSAASSKSLSRTPPSSSRVPPRSRHAGASVSATASAPSSARNKTSSPRSTVSSASKLGTRSTPSATPRTKVASTPAASPNPTKSAVPKRKPVVTTSQAKAPSTARSGVLTPTASSAARAKRVADAAAKPTSPSSARTQRTAGSRPVGGAKKPPQTATGSPRVSSQRPALSRASSGSERRILSSLPPPRRIHVDPVSTDCPELHNPLAAHSDDEDRTEERDTDEEDGVQWYGEQDSAEREMQAQPTAQIHEASATSDTVTDHTVTVAAQDVPSLMSAAESKPSEESDKPQQLPQPQQAQQDEAAESLSRRQSNWSTTSQGFHAYLVPSLSHESSLDVLAQQEPTGQGADSKQPSPQQRQRVVAEQDSEDDIGDDMAFALERRLELVHEQQQQQQQEQQRIMLQRQHLQHRGVPLEGLMSVVSERQPAAAASPAGAIGPDADSGRGLQRQQSQHSIQPHQPSFQFPVRPRYDHNADFRPEEVEEAMENISHLADSPVLTPSHSLTRGLHFVAPPQSQQLPPQALSSHPPSSPQRSWLRSLAASSGRISHASLQQEELRELASLIGDGLEDVSDGKDDNERGTSNEGARVHRSLRIDATASPRSPQCIASPPSASASSGDQQEPRISSASDTSRLSDAQPRYSSESDAGANSSYFAREGSASPTDPSGSSNEFRLVPSAFDSPLVEVSTIKSAPRVSDFSLGSSSYGSLKDSMASSVEQIRYSDAPIVQRAEIYEASQQDGSTGSGSWPFDGESDGSRKGDSGRDSEDSIGRECDVDPSMEFDAPSFVDFTRPPDDTDEKADEWFERQTLANNVSVSNAATGMSDSERPSAPTRTSIPLSPRMSEAVRLLSDSELQPRPRVVDEEDRHVSLASAYSSGRHSDGSSMRSSDQQGQRALRAASLRPRSLSGLDFTEISRTPPQPIRVFTESQQRPRTRNTTFFSRMFGDVTPPASGGLRVERVTMSAPVSPTSARLASCPPWRQEALQPSDKPSESTQSSTASNSQGVDVPSLDASPRPWLPSYSSLSLQADGVSGQRGFGIPSSVNADPFVKATSSASSLFSDKGSSEGQSSLEAFPGPPGISPVLAECSLAKLSPRLQGSVRSVSPSRLSRSPSASDSVSERIVVVQPSQRVQRAVVVGHSRRVSTTSSRMALSQSPSFSGLSVGGSIQSSEPASLIVGERSSVAPPLSPSGSVHSHAAATSSNVTASSLAAEAAGVARARERQNLVDSDAQIQQPPSGASSQVPRDLSFKRRNAAAQKLRQESVAYLDWANTVLASRHLRADSLCSGTEKLQSGMHADGENLEPSRLDFSDGFLLTHLLEEAWQEPVYRPTSRRFAAAAGAPPDACPSLSESTAPAAPGPASATSPVQAAATSSASSLPLTLSGSAVPEPVSEVQRLELVNQCFEFLRAKQVPLEGIDPLRIVRRDPKATVQLLFHAVRGLALRGLLSLGTSIATPTSSLLSSTFRGSELRAMQQQQQQQPPPEQNARPQPAARVGGGGRDSLLLAWVNRVLRSPSGTVLHAEEGAAEPLPAIPPVEDFWTSFLDGRALCAVVNHLAPGSIDMSSLSEHEPERNLALAFEVGRSKLGITPPLTLADVAPVGGGMPEDFDEDDDDDDDDDENEDGSASSPALFETKEVETYRGVVVHEPQPEQIKQYLNLLLCAVPVQQRHKQGRQAQIQEPLKDEQAAACPQVEVEEGVAVSPDACRVHVHRGFSQRALVPVESGPDVSEVAAIHEMPSINGGAAAAEAGRGSSSTSRSGRSSGAQFMMVLEEDMMPSPLTAETVVTADVQEAKRQSLQVHVLEDEGEEHAHEVVIEEAEEDIEGDNEDEDNASGERQGENRTPNRSARPSLPLRLTYLDTENDLIPVERASSASESCQDTSPTVVQRQMRHLEALPKGLEATVAVVDELPCDAGRRISVVEERPENDSEVESESTKPPQQQAQKENVEAAVKDPQHPQASLLPPPELPLKDPLSEDDVSVGVPSDASSDTEEDHDVLESPIVPTNVPWFFADHAHIKMFALACMIILAAFILEMYFNPHIAFSPA